MSPRRLLASAEQQADVRRRAVAGERQRAIAAAVFGSDRLHNRVARILQRDQEDEERLRAEVKEFLAIAASPTSSLAERARALLAAYRVQVFERLEREHVRSSEVLALAQLEQLVDNLEHFEQLREMTRQPRAPSA